MTTTTRPPGEPPNSPAHTHPEHTCPECPAAENAQRVGFEPDHRELHPDWSPRRAATYRYIGGPLDGRRIWVAPRFASPWRTIDGCPIPWRGDPTVRYYRANHAERVYRAVS